LLLDSSPAVSIPDLLIRDNVVGQSERTTAGTSISSDFLSPGSQHQVRQHEQRAIPGEPSPKRATFSVPPAAATVHPNTSHVSSTDEVTIQEPPEVRLFHEHA